MGMRVTKRLRSPIWWFGGKGMMVAKLLKYIPPHRVYVEPFGGGASLLLAKDPSPVEVYNDLDSGLVNFFRVLRDPKQFKRFYRKVILTPYSREEFFHCLQTWEVQDDPVERAYRWFVVARMSFSGSFGASWSFTVGFSCGGMSMCVSRWLSAIGMLPEISTRLLRVQVEHHDFRKIFEIYDTEETFFYCDPPYVSGMRSGGEYAHEMTDEDHRDLVQILLGLKGKALLSCYDHSVYEPLKEAGWDVVSFKTACFATAKTRASGVLGAGSAMKKAPRIETLYMNYSITKEKGGLF